MKKTKHLRSKYSKQLIPFRNKPTLIGLPKANVIVKDPISQKETEFSNKFLLDTGATISILNNKYSDFFKNVDIINEIKIQYGRGKPSWLPVYNVIFIIKGREFESEAALDQEAAGLILGHHKFFENFRYNLFDSVINECRQVF